jgi:hypothetical protein
VDFRKASSQAAAILHEKNQRPLRSDQASCVPVCCATIAIVVPIPVFVIFQYVRCEIRAACYIPRSHFSRLLTKVAKRGSAILVTSQEMR